MDTLWRDIRRAVRSLLKTRGATAISVLALALGIGCNISCFITVNALVLHPLPYPALDRVMTLWETTAAGGQDQDAVSPANFIDWKSRSHTFEHLAAYRAWDVTLTASGDPERVQACLVTSDFFSLLGLAPAMGRAISAADTEPGRDGVVVVSHGFWRTRLASSPDTIGRPLTLGGRVYHVIGVMPKDFDFPLATEVWAPLALTPQQQSDRTTRGLLVLGRLSPGVSFAEARGELDSIASHLASDYPESNERRGALIIPLRQLTNNVTDHFVVTLLGAAAFVLLLACANVGNLQLSRAAARQKLFAVQAALGASRLRLARELAIESVLLALAGGGIGLCLESWHLDYTRNVVIPAEIYHWVAGLNYLRIDAAALAFTLAASLVAGLLCGLPGAWHLLRPKASANLIEALKEGGRGAGLASPRSRLRSALVIGEVAIALVLLAGAGIMVRSFNRLLALNPGYDTSHLLMMQVSLPSASYPDDASIRDFYSRLLSEFALLSDAKSVGAEAFLPLAGGFVIEGRPDPRPGDLIPEVRAVSDRYLQTLGLPLASGRFLSPRDGAESPRVAVISASLARHYWPDEPNPAAALGHRIHLEGARSPWFTIVGVVADVRDWFTRQPEHRVYVPYVQSPRLSMRLLVRTMGDPLRSAGAARTAIRRVDRNQPLYAIKSVEQAINEDTSGVRASSSTMTVYAAIALLLAVSGIFAVTSYSVVQRTHEIGVRMALGARTGQVLRMTIGYGLRVAAAGLAIGLPLVFLLMRLVSRVLYDVVAVDPVTLILFTAILAAAAVAASYLPARQATRVDPLTALRVE